MSGLADVQPISRPRGSNLARTARTQGLLLEATVDCLFRFGFGMTTTHLVADVAGVSRGAVVHHFGTKCGLIVAAVRYAWKGELASMDRELATLERGLARFRGLIDVHRTIVHQPEDIAIHEVRIGARSDPQLAMAVRPVMAEIANEHAHYIEVQVRDAGLELTEEVRGLAATWVLALPMLACHGASDPERRMEDSLIATLKGIQEAIIARQLPTP